MAKHLQQMDLFGSEPSEAVHIAAPKPSKVTTAIPKAVVAKTNLEEDALPVVSRAAQHLNTHHSKQKRGRKSFAAMDAEMGKLNIPSAEILQQKLYYPIGEVAHWFNVNTSLIRYWEKEFKQLQPRKTRKGDRLFRAQDIEFLKQIHFLLREKKYSIDGAKTYSRDIFDINNTNVSQIILDNLNDLFLLSYIFGKPEKYDGNPQL